VTWDTLFYAKRNAEGLWMRPTGGGPERRVLDDLDEWGNWAVSANGLYFTRRTEGAPQIVFRPFGANTERVVAAVPTINNPSLEVSPDGERCCRRREWRKETVQERKGTTNETDSAEAGGLVDRSGEVK
jgi:hypothetical protein